MTATLSTPIARGRTAEVYAWDDGHILKLYYDWCPSHWVQDESRIARSVHDAGIPSPKAGDILEIDGRRGLIYERIEGISMLQDMNVHPWNMFRHARSLAELQVKINKQSIRGLPSYKDELHYAIGRTSHLTNDLRTKSLSRLAALPDGQSVCHGDYHPGNVILSKNGPVVIDWMTARAGDPWADVARTDMILTVGVKAAGKQVSAFIRIGVKLCRQIYLNRYHALLPDSNHELDRWMPVIAAARLNEDISPERDALLDMIKDDRSP